MDLVDNNLLLYLYTALVHVSRTNATNTRVNILVRHQIRREQVLGGKSTPIELKLIIKWCMICN